MDVTKAMIDQIVKECTEAWRPQELPRVIEGLMKSRALNALEKIRATLDDNSLSDFDCIEQITCILEEIGSNGGSRHDFG